MDTAQNNHILRLINVKKVFAYGSVDEVTALAGINLDVNDDDFVTIIGSNGAGKSTLLNIVGGLYPPENGGKVIIRGEDVTNLVGYRRASFVGRVWQQPEAGTAGNFTIEENLSLALLRGQPRGLKTALSKHRRELFREKLAQVGLGLQDRLKVQAGTLSGGQRQALALVMATISKPPILLLDEHIATLDPKTVGTVLELTDKIVEREKIATIMVTHNMEVAIRHGNRLIMMHKGRIILDISGRDKSTLQISNLVEAFEQAAGEEFKDDTILLSPGERS